MRPVLDWIGIQPGERILELGPGPGVFTVPAAQRTGPGGVVIAADIQPAMVAALEERIRRSGIDNVQPCVASAHDLPLENESIDRAFLISVLPEIPDQRHAIGQLHRVLRVGGTLSITAEFADPDYHFLGETKRLIEAVGFELTSSYGNLWRYTANFRKSA